MRPSQYENMMQLAEVIALRSTCLRRAVGCVLINVEGRILATGYNGVAAGQPHCNEPTEAFLDGTPEVYGHACEGAYLPSGVGHDLCSAIHAEANALVWCREPDAIRTAIVTTAPCPACVKLLLGTHCSVILFRDDHPSAGQAKVLWETAGRSWVQLHE
ncbi:MAG: deoxycytidylate deaminase [Burkholderiales bacterium]